MSWTPHCWLLTSKSNAVLHLKQFTFIWFWFLYFKHALYSCYAYSFMGQLVKPFQSSLYVITHLDRTWEGGGEVLHCSHSTEGVSPVPISGARQLQTLFLYIAHTSRSWMGRLCSRVCICLHLYKCVGVGLRHHFSSCKEQKWWVFADCIWMVSFVQICAWEIANYGVCTCPPTLVALAGW